MLNYQVIEINQNTDGTAWQKVMYKVYKALLERDVSGCEVHLTGEFFDSREDVAVDVVKSTDCISEVADKPVIIRVNGKLIQR